MSENGAGDMRKYCKAYYLKDLQRFPSWSAHYHEEGSLTENAVVYLWDDFTVVKSPVPTEQEMLWKSITPEWETFCKEILQFEIPADLRYTYEREPEAKDKVKES